MIFTYNDYVLSILEHLDRAPSKIYVSTYNLQIGISARGGVYDKSDSHRVVRAINESTKGSRILVGLPPHADAVNKLTNSAEYFGNIFWKYRVDCHLKCWIFFYKTTTEAIIGGRNLGDSSWHDVSLWLGQKDSRKLATYFDQLWLSAKPVSKTTLQLNPGKDSTE